MKRVTLTKDVMIRAIRIHKTPMNIATALGVTHGSVTRACRRYGLKWESWNTKQSPVVDPRPKADYGRCQIEADKVLALIAEDKLRRETHGSTTPRNYDDSNKGTG
mgnify:CR=1 FL=1|jgi:hypothetical protein